MTGIRMDGKEVARALKVRLVRSIKETSSDRAPCLATVLVGNDAASETYVRNKHAACKEVGIATRDHRLAATVSQAELDTLVGRLGKDDGVDGILVQLPLPEGLDRFATISKIPPSKDVDGLTPHNTGLFAMRRAALVPCTPAGIIEMLDYYKIEAKGKNITIINRSALIGRPLACMLVQRDATVTVCHSRTPDVSSHCKKAEIVVSAVGNREKFELLPDMISEGAVIIDAAITRYEGRLAGDAEYSKIIEKASYATPVPGGVGPMTVAMLLKNTLVASRLRRGLGRL